MDGVARAVYSVKQAGRRRLGRSHFVLQLHDGLLRPSRELLLANTSQAHALEHIQTSGASLHLYLIQHAVGLGKNLLPASKTSLRQFQLRTQ